MARSRWTFAALHFRLDLRVPVQEVEPRLMQIARTPAAGSRHSARERDAPACRPPVCLMVGAPGYDPGRLQQSAAPVYKTEPHASADAVQRMRAIFSSSRAADGRSGWIRTSDLFVPNEERFQAALHSGNGAPRSMKMGTIASPWRYDAAARPALQSANLRRPAILHYALWTA
jgi:hypothetical protein